jgi:succinate dehydrogenase / fumarate reductase cytochrome b subunit
MSLSDNLFWRRLHSFTGAAPLGVYLLFHLYQNSYSIKGAAVYDAQVRPLKNIPYLNAIEIAVIFAPLTYHALYGLYIWYTGKSNAFQYCFYRNWLYTKQRITGIIALAFICYHVYDQRFRPEATFANVSGSLSHPLVLALYVIGVAAVAWHFGNGVWNVFIKWGVTVGRKSQKVSLYVFSALGVGLIIVGLRALAGFMG